MGAQIGRVHTDALEVFASVEEECGGHGQLIRIEVLGNDVAAAMTQLQGLFNGMGDAVERMLFQEPQDLDVFFDPLDTALLFQASAQQMEAFWQFPFRQEKLGRFPISGGSIDGTVEAGNREASHFSMCAAMFVLTGRQVGVDGKDGLSLKFKAEDSSKNPLSKH